MRDELVHVSPQKWEQLKPFTSITFYIHVLPSFSTSLLPITGFNLHRTFMANQSNDGRDSAFMMCIIVLELAFEIVSLLKNVHISDFL